MSLLIKFSSFGLSSVCLPWTISHWLPKALTRNGKRNFGEEAWQMFVYFHRAYSGTLDGSEPSLENRRTHLYSTSIGQGITRT